MPASLKLAREFGDDLALVMVESQGSNMEEQEAFVWKRKWMGTQAMWTTERPFDTGAGGLPNFALLSAEGEVLLMGNPSSMHGKIEDAIAEEIAKAKKIPDDTPKAVKKAWKEFVKGNYAKAVAEARKVEAKGGEDGEIAAGAVEDFVDAVENKFARVGWLLDNGYVGQAESLFKDLSKQTKGLEDVAELAAELTQRFEAPELESELDAAKLFERIESKLQEEGFEEKLVRKLEDFVEKNSDTKVAERAKHILELSKS